MSRFKQPSSSKQQSKFATVPRADVKRSRFSRSHGLKTTFGYPRGGSGSEWYHTGNALVPIYWDEVLPGDSFHMKSTMFARLATPLHPIMDNMFIDVHYFFVPYRLVWDNWQYFMGERKNPDDDPSQFTIPQVPIENRRGTAEVTSVDDLYQYMGLPFYGATEATVENRTYVSSLPFRAYRLIWNEWYRDQNVQDSVPVNTSDEWDTAIYSEQLLPRGKRKDYFTSALPWPQKGDPVTIPIEAVSIETLGGPTEPNLEVRWTGSGYDSHFYAGSGDRIRFEGEVLGGTINDLRTAFQIQRLLERDARGGTRYTELIQSHFGVTSPDSRLQRPEYLGGGTSRVTINPVANTAGGSRPEGDLAGYATSVNQATFSKSFTEHGIILGLASYRADLTYQRGIERFWSRKTRYDFFWPALAHLGEQAILNKEIHYTGDPEYDEAVFAYQERYGEYRYKPSRTTGLFNSDAKASLDAWHLAQDFPPDQPLPFNNTFILEEPPIGRTIAVPSEPYLIADVWFDLECDRPMPIYAVPGFADHF